MITNKLGFDDKDKKGRDGKKIPEVELYCTCMKKMGSCSIVTTHKGNYLKQTLKYIMNLLKYLKVMHSDLHSLQQMDQ